MNKKYKVLIGFYEKNFNKVYSFYFHKVKHDVSLAEDLTQNAFLKAFEKLDLYDEQFAFSTWFWRLASNMLIDHYRKYKNEHFIAFESLENVADIVTNETICEEVDKNLKFESVLQVLETLPEQKKELLLLYYVSEVPIKVIAEIYHTTTNNIRVQISRTVSQLSYKLAN